MKEFGIYKWTCLVNGRVLVGQCGSTTGFKKRLAAYLSTLRRGVYGSQWFQRSFTKHGEANFVFEIIETHTDDSRLTEREQFWVDYYRAQPAGVYNEVGPVDAPRRGTMMSEEAKEKRRKTLAAKPPFRHTEESKRRMSEARVGKKYSAKRVENSALGHQKPIERIHPDTGEIREYNSLEDAKKDGFKPASISAVCHGHHILHGGFFWQFLEEWRRVKPREPYDSKFKPVERADPITGDTKIYGSINEAASDTGCARGGISKVLNGHADSYKGFLWRLAQAPGAVKAA